jgi:two-component system response regulator AtoC
VINIFVPPIRERKDEIGWLADYFLKKHATETMPAPLLTPALLEAMMAHDWPGNVREIENMMRKYLVLRQPRIIIDELRALALSQDRPGAGGADFSEAAKGSSILERVHQSKQREETEAILAALTTAHWNRKHAARLLKLDYKAFLYKMKKLGIESKPTATA